MIASLRGRVVSLRLDAVVLEVGGVGLLVQATPGTLAELRPGQEAQLFTSMVVREDALTLFGFAEADERDVFETVQTVSGIGPRLALAMLAVHTPEGLRKAVAGQDLTALMRVPGIGRKGAQRIVLELTDRLGAPSTGTGAGGTAAGSAAAGAPAPWRDQVLDALVGLGWPARQASEAVDSVVGTTNSAVSVDLTGDPPDMAQVLRAALRQLGRTG
ncbi:MAG TPA: Holliday junction branch migration protein RuvA [Kineosporiaceae bacterium]|nr:Holliday junction branch migration protein RuvA [Kineosporiaceae bacterium]